jgi:tetratricopeptide (TPR) repeat protein
LVEQLGGTPEALRDLSVSLNNVGKVAEAQGDWVQAEAAYRESLGLRRQLVERLGSTPEALDDLGISLLNLTRVPGQHEVSLRQEALAIYQELASKFPNVPSYRTKLQKLLAAKPASATPEASPPALAPKSAI